MRRATTLLFVNAWLASSDASAQNPAPMNSADAAAFAAYLQRQNLTQLWRGDATRISSAEIRSVYPALRFYYTYRPPPKPPGAASAELQQRYHEQLDSYRQSSLRLTIGIDAEGQVHAFRSAEDFNVGLVPVTSSDNARLAAAAIISLIGNEHVVPGVVVAGEVQVSQSNTGWNCRVTQPRGINATVEFDQRGRCVAISKNLNYSPPLPP